jgi:hypothetical protein
VFENIELTADDEIIMRQENVDKKRDELEKNITQSEKDYVS